MLDGVQSTLPDTAMVFALGAWFVNAVVMRHASFESAYAQTFCYHDIHFVSAWDRHYHTYNLYKFMATLGPAPTYQTTFSLIGATWSPVRHTILTF